VFEQLGISNAQLFKPDEVEIIDPFFPQPDADWCKIKDIYHIGFFPLFVDNCQTIENGTGLLLTVLDAEIPFSHLIPPPRGIFFK
jgi:hypothetical protein